MIRNGNTSFTIFHTIQHIKSFNNICKSYHYCDAIMDTVASQITSLTIVYTTVYSDADQSKHQSSASLAFVWGIHRGPVNSPHKWPVTRKMFPFDDVIMIMELTRCDDAAALMRPIPPEAGHYRDKSAHPMDARMHPKGVRGPCCVR